MVAGTGRPRSPGGPPFRPTPPGVLTARLERVARSVREHGLAALVVYSAPVDLGNATRTVGHVRYLSNWSDRNQPAVLIVPADRAPILIVYGGSARTAWPRARDVPVAEVRNGGSTDVGQVLASIGGGRIGVAGRREMTVPIYEQLARGRAAADLVTADDLIDVDRAVKEPWELERHAVAAEISDSMLEAFFRGCRPGRAAWRCLADMEAAGRSLGAEYASGWIATGPKLEGAHYNVWQHQRVLERGDLVAAGTNVVFDGYWGHELRMGIIGTVPSELDERHARVVAAQERGIRALRPGTPLRDVAAAVEGAIDADPDLDRDGFRGNGCHGLGLQYNDPITSEALLRGSVSELAAQPGMVIEVHPNYSVEPYGYLCIGDMALVTDGAARVLTGRPREILAV